MTMKLSFPLRQSPWNGTNVRVIQGRCGLCPRPFPPGKAFEPANRVFGRPPGGKLESQPERLFQARVFRLYRRHPSPGPLPIFSNDAVIARWFVTDPIGKDVLWLYVLGMALKY